MKMPKSDKQEILDAISVLGNRIGGLESGQRSLESGQKSLASRMDGLESGQRSLESGQKSLASRMDGLESGQKSLESGQKSLESRQKNLELGQKSLESGQKSLELGQKSLASRMDGLESHQNEMFEMMHAFAEGVDGRFIGIDQRLDRLEKEQARMHSVMVDKDYLDRKLLDLKSYFFGAVQKGDQRVNALVGTLKRKRTVTSKEANGILSHRAFVPSRS